MTATGISCFYHHRGMLWGIRRKGKEAERARTSEIVSSLSKKKKKYYTGQLKGVCAKHLGCLPDQTDNNRLPLLKNIVSALKEPPL